MSQQWRGAPRPTGWENYSYTRNRVSDQPLRTISRGGCWCGMPHGHDWPGKADGAPHPQGEELTAMVSDYERRKQERWAERRDTDERLQHGQLKKFKREVRDALLLLVNTHGVEYRLQADGQHLMLYSGARGERPFKVAASRTVAAQMRLLVPWVREHFPQIDLSTGKSKETTAFGLHLFDPNSEAKCKVCGFEEEDGRAEHFDPALAANQPPEEGVHHIEQEEEMTVFETVLVKERGPELVDLPPGDYVVAPGVAERVEKEIRLSLRESALLADGWERYVYPTKGPSEVFWFKDDLLQCTFEGCSFTKKGSFAGAHMHEAVHTGEAEEMRQKGLEVRRANTERREEMLAETLDILLRPHGYVAVKREDAVAIKEASGLREKCERLQSELDELRAKFDLAKEAFGL